MNGMLCHTNFIESLPLEPPHFSKFFGIPTRKPKIEPKTGEWKECQFCGAEGTLGIPTNKGCGITIKLTNHVPKMCTYRIFTDKEHQLVLTSGCATSKTGKSNKSATTNTSGTPEEFKQGIDNQIKAFSAIYRAIKDTVAQDYAKFFKFMMRDVPTSYQDTLIGPDGKKYELVNLQGALEDIHNLTGRQCNYAQHFERYRAAHNRDVDTMEQIMRNYHNNDETLQRNEKMFSQSLSSAMILAQHGILNIHPQHHTEVLLTKPSSSTSTAAVASSSIITPSTMREQATPTILYQNSETMAFAQRLHATQKIDEHTKTIAMLTRSMEFTTDMDKLSEYNGQIFYAQNEIDRLKGVIQSIENSQRQHMAIVAEMTKQASPAIIEPQTPPPSLKRVSFEDEQPQQQQPPRPRPPLFYEPQSDVEFGDNPYLQVFGESDSEYEARLAEMEPRVVEL